MKSIRFKSAYGDEKREIEISQVSGSLNQIHIYFTPSPNIYWALGTINYAMGKWRVNWVVPTERTVNPELYVMDDTDAILDRLRDANWID